MRKKLFLTGSMALIAAGLFLSGCGSDQKSEMRGDTHEKGAAQTAATSSEYPLDYCLVSGEELGGMGDPIVSEYKGRTFKFCCKNCVKAFKAEPDLYVAKLDSVLAGQLEQSGSTQPGGHDDHEGHNHGG